MILARAIEISTWWSLVLVAAFVYLVWRLKRIPD
jgi:hypothetical protein